MDPLEKAVRDAAAALKTAIAAAEAGGYRVDFPRHASQLEAIAVSSTRKNHKPEPKADADAKADKKVAAKEPVAATKET
ncbi:hypothetical protein [Mesorhizobium sp. B2-4-6]|uniref:hypothetical protein n=1 Tax=Mesorhizobium sp. B2-4-6 TaxID=2589943 RepID=UPI00112953C3|nr:hypothetical protein [Mesorhizobium sp. B2-4-6]TPL40696.1 hypothetical protein FJ957_26050 [Mesorhizobium sp. B2-4-6]